MACEYLKLKLVCRLVYSIVSQYGEQCMYVDIMTGEKLSSFYVANKKLVYCSVRSSSRRGGDGVKGSWKGGNRYFSRLHVSHY